MRDILVLNETMPAVQPKAKMMPALEVCQSAVHITAMMVLTRTTFGNANKKKGLESCQRVISSMAQIKLTS